MASPLLADLKDAARSVVLTGKEAQAVFNQCSRPTVNPIEGYWAPTPADVKKLEKNLPGFFKEKEILSISEIPTYEKYFFQYSGFIKHGHKLIYINAFPSSFVEEAANDSNLDWKIKAIVICDGGPSFFGVVYDPSTGKFGNSRFNGGI